jgi:NADPH:quinone reductase-like Zn-dependent oxidoreductase
MGNDEEFEKMVKLVSDKKIIPVIDSVRPFEEGVAAFNDMRQNKKSGKLVLKF